MKTCVLYLHGRGGSAAEIEHYRPLFPGCAAVGLDYRGDTPWDVGEEIREAVEDLKNRYDSVILIANSIGAYFSMCAGVDKDVRRAYFISPVVDLERVILDMMSAADVTRETLREKGVIRTAFGETLSWEQLQWVRAHPPRWDAPTQILYGSRDNLVSLETVAAFAQTHGASLTVMEGGEHWFHTEEQMRFLDAWIREG